MERSTKDEGFVGRALDMLEPNDARVIANQDYFNGHDSEEVCQIVKATLVTATKIYIIKYKLPPEAMKEAINVQTLGETREFIDKCDIKLRNG
ncbi:hypothetical protein [Vibrio hepatarius]|uniref:hypothetical protein n=1 Tax=Vibrio hepatarius TaxID=171383 RepID=UPI001C096AE9|nr:hypothetical protein [Vibrio hepatarius]MBU2897702.1 hypothetical protein [Vibrio hepatarius]